jgi:hypothetical protein
MPQNFRGTDMLEMITQWHLPELLSAITALYFFESR